MKYTTTLKPNDVNERLCGLMSTFYSPSIPFLGRVRKSSFRLTLQGIWRGSYPTLKGTIIPKQNGSEIEIRISSTFSFIMSYLVGILFVIGGLACGFKFETFIFLGFGVCSILLHHASLKKHTRQALEILTDEISLKKIDRDRTPHR